MSKKKPFSFINSSLHCVRHYFWVELWGLPNPMALAATTTTPFSTPPLPLHLRLPAAMPPQPLQPLHTEHLLSLSAPCKG